VLDSRLATRRAALRTLSALALARCTSVAPSVLAQRSALTMNTRIVTHVAPALRQANTGFLVARLAEAMFGRGSLDPFIAGDEFSMAHPVFAPHPHAGFSAVTWMFEDGDGAFTNRDTFSDPRSVQIEPGALHWTAAGRGMVHEEVPTISGRAAHGVQLFVDLPRTLKQAPPEAHHASARDIPVVPYERARVRVVTGAHGAVRSALAVPTEVTLLDVLMDARAKLTHRAPATHNALVWVRRGAVKVNDTLVRAHSVARLAPSSELQREEIHLEAVDPKSELVIMHGRPLGQPVLSHGPFVGASAEELRAYVERYQRGEMGSLVPSFSR
jgi:redox-sensitive bicupin YhaK (pirin superfamily)